MFFSLDFLKQNISMLGFKEGFSIWFHTVKHFIWLNFSKKEYCTYSGWYCRAENCSHKHIVGRKAIKQNIKEGLVELKRIEEGKNGTCVYCGEVKGTEIIPNPNFDEINQWKVCKTCKEIIELQKELGFLSLSVLGTSNKDRIFEINNRLLEIEKESGKKMFSTTIEEIDGKYGVREI